MPREGSKYACKLQEVPYILDYIYQITLFNLSKSHALDSKRWEKVSHGDALKVPQISCLERPNDGNPTSCPNFCMKINYIHFRFKISRECTLKVIKVSCMVTKLTKPFLLEICSTSYSKIPRDGTKNVIEVSKFNFWRRDTKRRHSIIVGSEIPRNGTQ